MMPFDPDAPAAPASGIFGLPHTPEEALVHVIGVPFDATTSYRNGAAMAPAAILAASAQVDLYDLWTERPFEAGIAMLEMDPRIEEWNREARLLAKPIIDAGGIEAIEAGKFEEERRLGFRHPLTEDERIPDWRAALRRIDELGERVGTYVHDEVASALHDGRLPCVLGGDHSVPFGAIQACGERHPELGILHIDAHADLRPAYEGFTWSHASIMHNVLERIPAVERIVQIGVRDLGLVEKRAIEESGGRVQTVFDKQWARARFQVGSTIELVRTAILKLPEHVYLSFDIDGLDPSLCPNTGTPVPGGLDWHEAMLVLEELSKSGRKVVGMDLCECSPGEKPDRNGESWDAIVGARMLYRMIGFALVCNR
ncbi:MAG: agmatinase [Planctomycetota bacterium]|jgi:agmatinase